MALSEPTRTRIVLQKNDGAGRGPGTVEAVIEDAKNLGVSNYANEAGELFFTLPLSHPAVNIVNPLQQHYTVYRRPGSSNEYRRVAFGLIDDYEISADEMVVYGTDYLGALEASISAANTSYTNATVQSIVTDQLSAAITEANSRIGWTDGSSNILGGGGTATLLTSFEPRLAFIRGAANVVMSNTSQRSLLTHETPGFWGWNPNGGVEDKTETSGVLLEYGGLIRSFRFWTGRESFATRIFGIGIKRDGASVLYSTQTYASEATYGWIARPTLHRDVINQAALDAIVLRDARNAGNTGSQIALELHLARTPNIGGLGPGGVLVGDSLRVVIERGVLALNDLYTIWGWEWLVAPDGQERFFLNLVPKLT